MRKEDLKTIAEVWPSWASDLKRRVGDRPHVCALSPDERELRLLESLFDGPSIDVVGIDDWHLNDPCQTGPYDLVVASNVFFCSSRPKLWFENVFACCRFFWLLDAISGRRGSGFDYMTGLQGYLGDDGDHMRFSMPPDYVSDFEDAFDISAMNVVEFEPFFLDDGNVHFVSSMRGNIK